MGVGSRTTSGVGVGSVVGSTTTSGVWVGACAGSTTSGVEAACPQAAKIRIKNTNKDIKILFIPKSPLACLVDRIWFLLDLL
jgi:hypothetical protein